MEVRHVTNSHVRNWMCHDCSRLPPHTPSEVFVSTVWICNAAQSCWKSRNNEVFRQRSRKTFSQSFSTNVKWWRYMKWKLSVIRSDASLGCDGKVSTFKLASSSFGSSLLGSLYVLANAHGWIPLTTQVKSRGEITSRRYIQDPS